MRVVEIRQETGLGGLQCDWDGLLRTSASASVFVSWEWVSAWWGTYGNPGDLFLLAAFDDQGVLRGIAPLRQRPERRYGHDFELLSFVGDHSNDADYLDFVIAAGYERAVMEAFWQHLAGKFKRGTVLELNEIPENSPNLALLRGLAEKDGVLWTESDTPCSTVRLPENWEEYLASLSHKFRKQIRALLRKSESHEGVSCGFCDSMEQVEEMLPALFDLHTRRWAEEGKPGVFGWDKKRDFYRKLSAEFLRRGWLRFSWLRWNERIVACQFGFVYGTVYYHLQEGHEPVSEHWSFGTVLRAWSIREFLVAGIREYDFLSGSSWHKKVWGAGSKLSKRVLLASATARNVLFCRGPQYQARLRESLAAIVPEKVLATRRAIKLRASQRAFEPVGSGQPNGSSINEWMLKTAARCYYYLELPAITRKFRDRYQLSESPATGRPRLAVVRRNHASVRILCYHRVNDERDPFLPAMSTTAFERQMRFLARHYKVASLTSALEHLQSDATDPVLVITFDDGYEDNYRNAFPILQRYRLPATVFLSTECIDRGRAPWFSRLAQAIKTTDREFVDLEIDIPRRFRFRTEKERLESNRQVFSLLRATPEDVRKFWFERLLRDLAPKEEDTTPERMLTWDQIRQMKSSGIDFGSHTVSHPFLSKLTPEQATWEVSESKRRIEEELQNPVLHFAYPNGREPDLSAWNKELLRAAGYQAAVSTIWGVNLRSTDPMELRRGQPWEQDQAMFAYKLAWYQFANS